jgi:hypothetical protein
MRTRLLSVLVAAAASATGLAACGDTTNNRHADNEGIYVDLGKLKYQVQLSRQLNTFSAEDSAYVAGLSPVDKKLDPQQAWFAVFMLVVNKTGKAEPTATPTDYFITDTQARVYKPLANPGDNPFVYRAATLPGHTQLPSQDSMAYDGPTQGAVLLFKVPIATYDNRPLILHIQDPRDPRQLASVELDV